MIEVLAQAASEVAAANDGLLQTEHILAFLLGTGGATGGGLLYRRYSADGQVSRNGTRATIKHIAEQIDSTSEDVQAIKETLAADEVRKGVVARTLEEHSERLTELEYGRRKRRR